MHKKLLVALSAAGILALAGCGGDAPTPPVKPDLEPPLSGEYVADFSLGESEEIFASDGWSNGQPFNAVWKKSNLTYSDGEMHLGIKDEPTVASEVEYPYTAGEARTHHLYGYGDYMVKMKPTNVVGSVSTFFTFTYDGDKIDGVANKHDEIDIEFLGKDTTKVQFNYFVGGVGEHEFMYDLGFDASEDFHEYGFRWEENKITWVVDGKIAHEVTGDKTTLPSCPGRIMSSYWPSSADDWSGHFAGATDDTVDYKYIKASATGIWADGEEPVPPFDEDIDWSEVDAFDNDYWNGGSHYTINKIEKGVEVTYEEAGNWECVGTYIGADGAEAEAVNVTLFNGSDSESTVKVDVQGTTKVGNHNDINVAAYADGHPEVSTDLDWGGSKIVLASKEEAQLKIEIDQTTDRGALTNLAFFLDSLQASNVAHEGGKVVIKDVKLAKLDGTPIVPPTPVPPGPGPQPGGEIDWDKIDPVAMTYWASNETYTFTDNGTNAVTVNYTDTKQYACIGSGSANTTVDANNTAKVTLRNNNEAVAHVRMDVQLTDYASYITSAKAEGAENVYANGGSAFVDIGVNGVVDLIVEYSTPLAASNVMFFIDSMSDNPVSGSVTISNVKFAKSEEPAPAEYEKLTFTTVNAYTLDPKDVATDTLGVSYADVGGNSYQNFSAGLGDVADKTSFTLNIKNEGEATVKVRIDVQGSETVGNTNAINTNAYADGHTEVYTDTTWGGSYIEVVAQEEVTFTVEFDQTTERGAAKNLMFFLDSARGNEETYSGVLTLSKFTFGPKVEPQPGEAVDLTFSTENSYVLDPAGVATSTLNVSYTDVGGASYQNFGAGLGGIEGKTVFSVTIKNNAETKSKVRVDIQGTTQIGETKDINVSAVAEGHTEIYTDTTYGGSVIEVAAGEEVTFSITFDQTTERGAATYLMFFVDSATYGDTGTYSGNITLSNFIFA